MNEYDFIYNKIVNNELIEAFNFLEANKQLISYANYIYLLSLILIKNYQILDAEKIMKKFLEDNYDKNISTLYTFCQTVPNKLEE
jgi:hypothetical protein